MEEGKYLHPVAMGSLQFSWNHCTCCEPSLVSVSRTRWSRGVDMTEGGTGAGDIVGLTSLAGRGLWWV